MTAKTIASCQVVLVDDDAFALRLLRLQLWQLGCRQVAAFAAAVPALEWIAQNPVVDLIMFDINMPEMDGIELIRRLAERDYRGALVPVSGESSRTLDTVLKLVKSRRLTALGVLQKPVQPRRLAEIVGQLGRVRNSGAVGRRAKRQYSCDELRAAMGQGDVGAHYQPKVSFATGEVTGVECLLRWQHPGDGQVPPDYFVELAARHGFMAELTRLALACAFKQISHWARMNVHMPVAVNVTMQDLEQLEFPDQIVAMAAEHGVDPALITLEVTEQQLVRRPSAVLDVLGRLSLKRIRLSMDDFGTGQSSLAQLRDLPFDELKIDRGFVHGAATDSTRRAICQASIRMAHQLRMRVVAEGVESTQDWQLLRHLGCDVCQGYLVAKPMPGMELVNWLTEWTRRSEALCAAE